MKRTRDKLESAARMCAAGGINEVEIAAHIGIGRRTLFRWKSHPIFEALYKALQEEETLRRRERLRAEREARHLAAQARARVHWQKYGYRR